MLIFNCSITAYAEPFRFNIVNQNIEGGENSLSEKNTLNQNIEGSEILKLKEIIKNLEESKSSYIEIIKNKDESLENDKNIQESLNIKIRNLENDKESLSMKYKNEKDLYLNYDPVHLSEKGHKFVYNLIVEKLF